MMMNEKGIVKENTIGKAWVECMRRVYNCGADFHDEDVIIKEFPGLLVEITDPQPSDNIVYAHGNGEMIKWMERNFLSTEPVFDENLSYGQRLFDYQGINQIDWVIEKLRNKPETKQAAITLLNAPIHLNMHIPCVCSLDFKIRDDKLNLYLFCRSQDIAKKMYADSLALLKIVNKISTVLNIEVGKMTSFISSAHIYEEDYDLVKSIINDTHI